MKTHIRFEKFLFIILLLFGSVVQAGSLPEKPILKIEAGMHTGTIWRLAGPLSGEVLYTCSNDKTIRGWDGKTGDLKKIIRLPSGLTDSGRVYCIDLAPGKRFLAASGWIDDKNGKKSIYIFDLLNDSVKKIITGLPAVSFDLRYSPDGRFLAVCLSGKNGIRIYSTSTWKMVRKDTDYKNGSYWAAFASNGWLYTSSYDGYVREYDNSFNLVSKIKAKGGKKLFAVDVSPDDKLLALGFSDSPQVEIFSINKLKHEYFVNQTGISGDSFNAVSWSWDGKQIYAGGKFWKNGQRPVVVWKNKGKEKPEFLPGASMTIMDINPVFGGGIFWGSSDPAFGRIDSSGRQILKKQSDLADFREIADNFRVSPSGDKIQYAYKVWGKELSVFSINDFSVFHGKGPDFYLPPKTTGIDIKDLVGYSPKLKGRKLKLTEHEKSRCIAVSQDNFFFILGTEWNIYKYSDQGKKLWSISAPGVTWKVNLTKDGKKLVGAFSDGTIRWYSAEDGKLLLSFFPHGDKKRWVCWSQSGYYAASPGGDSLIGWHINRGRDNRPDFFSAGRFRKKYARPEIVSKTIYFNDEQKAVSIADSEEGIKKGVTQIDKREMLPPVVKIMSPLSGYRFSSNEVDVEISIRNPSGLKIRDLKFLIDGRPVDSRRGLKKKNTGTYVKETIALPARNCRLSVIAEHSLAASEPSHIDLIWKGNDTPDWRKPSLYVLSVGVSDYDIDDLDLNYAAKDAGDFAKVWKDLEGGLYRTVKTNILTDSKADRNSVLDGFDWIEKETTTKDIAVVFLAGHGVTDRDGDYYYLPSDGNPDKLRRSGVSYSMIRDLASGISGKVIFFLDTCHSGRVYEGRRAPGGELNNIINDLSAAENGAVVFTAATGRQYALENSAWNNGAFTKAIVEGLKGKASYGLDNRITISMLEIYVSQRVKVLTNGRQTPATAKPGAVPDFPIATKF